MKGHGVVSRLVGARRILLLAAGAILALSIMGITAEAQETLMLSCSSQVYESFLDKAVAAFTKASGVQVKVDIVSSEAATSRLANGMSDLAASAERLDYRYRAAGFVEYPICKDPLVIIINAGNTAQSLTAEQVRNIFSGEIANWSEVGGKDKEIVTIIPAKENAAYRNFWRMIMAGEDVDFDLLASRSTMVLEATRRFPWSISFVTQGAVRGRAEGAKEVAVDGKTAGDADYPYFQVFSIVTKGQPTGTLLQFINFVFSDEVNGIITQHGMTPFAR